jgi:hypothetical protein
VGPSVEMRRHTPAHQRKPMLPRGQAKPRCSAPARCRRFGEPPASDSATASASLVGRRLVGAPSGEEAIRPPLLSLQAPLVGPGRVLFRPMREDQGQPALAPNALGVRLPQDAAQYGGKVDIYPDPDGSVHPQSGGMSITLDDPLQIPRHRRPVALGGDGNLPLWRIQSDDLPETLIARNDHDFHGLVEPASSMTTEAFVQYLEGTQPAWKADT